MENILKLLLLLATIYLLTTCYNCGMVDSKQEKFNNILSLNSTKPVDLTMYVNDVSYSFISLNQLKEEYKKPIVAALEKNADFINYKENIDNFKNGIMTKIPVFIVKTIDIQKFTEGKKLEFMVVPNSVPNFVLLPVINSKDIKNNYLYYDEKLDMLYYAENGVVSSNDIINITNDGFVKKFNIISDPEFSNLNIYILTPTDKEGTINVRISQS